MGGRGERAEGLSEGLCLRLPLGDGLVAVQIEVGQQRYADGGLEGAILTHSSTPSQSRRRRVGRSRCTRRRTETAVGRKHSRCSPHLR